MIGAQRFAAPHPVFRGVGGIVARSKTGVERGKNPGRDAARAAEKSVRGAGLAQDGGSKMRRAHSLKPSGSGSPGALTQMTLNSSPICAGEEIRCAPAKSSAAPSADLPKL